MNQTIITVKDVFKSFKIGDRYTHVLKNVSLDIYKGEFLIVFGPSGCGKSTLLHGVMGLERPDAGSIKLEGMDLWKMGTVDRTNTRKREIGIMYQQQNWIKSLTVIENIAFSGQLIGLEKEEALIRAEEVLKTVGMESRASYVPNELSAGEQQKVGVARSLMTNPKILIADEPTGNLDVKSGQEMIDLLLKLQKEGKTVIMVTHNPEYLKIADRVVLMLDGRIRKILVVAEENAEEVQKQIAKDLKIFIEKDANVIEEGNKPFPKPLDSNEDIHKRNIFQKIGYAIKFNITFILQSLFLITLVTIRFFSKYIKSFSKTESNWKKIFSKITRFIDKNPKGKISSSINSLDLTEISLKNLWIKKSRTMITIFGMAIGIGFIVFLLSLGYGLEKLVINEVTKIEDLKQIDVTPTVSSNVLLNAENVERISKIENVQEIMPLINIAARVGFEQSSTDVVVYGDQSQYIENSPITISEGDVFEDKSKEVVVNNEFLSTIGILPKDAVGKNISVDFVTSEITDQLDQESEIIEENREKNVYIIKGVVEDSNPSVIYVPILELENLKINEFSQLRIVIKDENYIPEVRKQIEVLGFETTSVMDTISQVESLFNYAKIGLLLVGTIALSIAILGMFNTLTVSLLERTREVGLMKTIGMQSDEIRSLFINESMLMGITGGTLGVAFGILLGFLLSTIISLVSISKGGAYIAINFLPISIILGIVFVSTFVGFVTGLYPSNRAVKMAPLDALRYE